MKTNKVIVITFNGDKHPEKIEPLQVASSTQTSTLTLPSNKISSFNPLDSNLFTSFSLSSPPLTKDVGTNCSTNNIKLAKNQKQLKNSKQQQNGDHDQAKQEVENDRGQLKKKKKKKNKNKTQFQIKNVLQQICSSVQNCLKDGFIPPLTLEFWQEQEKLQKMKGKIEYPYKQVIDKMQFYLENPSQHNIGCLLRMGGEVHIGLQRIFRSRVLKKYIQCSKIRTLKQKAICLQAVDYLYRCFKQQQLCSLHTWAHKRQQKIQNRIQRIEKHKKIKKLRE